VLGTRLLSRSQHTRFFNYYTEQYLFDGIDLVAHEYGVLLDLNDTMLKLLFLINGARQKREDRAKAASVR
jgi:hypothetical protein